MKRKSGNRAQRVGQQVHQIVASLLLTAVSDPRLESIQVTDVEMTPDLRQARVYYVMLDGNEPPEEVFEAVERVAGFIKSHLGSELRLRYVPEVEFRFDEAQLRGRRIDDLLSGIREE